MKYLYTIILILFTQSILAQSVTDYPTEMVRLQTEQDFYAIGDTLRFKAYLIDGASGLPSTSAEYPEGRSRFVYLELHDTQADTLVSRYMIKKDSTGLFANKVKIPMHLHTGYYTLVAYTRYMMNFSTDLFAYHNIYIQGEQDYVAPTSDDKGIKLPLRIKAVPEGGTLLKDFMQCVAYSIKDADDKGVNADVCIIDAQNDSVITSGKTEIDGMGRLFFIPRENRKYVISATTLNGLNVKTDIGIAAKTGVTLRVNARKEYIYIEPLLMGYGIEQLTFIVHGSGKTLSVSPNDNNYIKLDKRSLPKGLLNISVLNKTNNEVLADRLLYND